MARPKKEEFNQIKYQNEYNKSNYDRVGIVMPKGRKDVIKKKAMAAGQSMSEYVNQAIEERMERDGDSEAARKG
jgi:hypothetical protein